MPPTDRPQWDGGPLPGGRLLLVADQGYGDVIQFARYIPWAAQRCPDIAVACSVELHPVIAQLAGAGIRVPGGFATTAFAFGEFLASNQLEERIAKRLNGWSPPEPQYRKGVLARYALLVGSASEGAMLKP